LLDYKARPPVLPGGSGLESENGRDLVGGVAEAVHWRWSYYINLKDTCSGLVNRLDKLQRNEPHTEAYSVSQFVAWIARTARVDLRTARYGA
jgi:hypothetical protein